MLSIPLVEYNERTIFFGEKTRNNIIENIDFYTIHYSTDYFTLNNIVLHFDLYNVEIETYYNKYKCTFQNKELNSYVLETIQYIEKTILEQFSTNKMRIYKLSEQLDKNNIKIFSNVHIQTGEYKTLKLVIKISGVWEDSQQCGIIYKFMLQ
jgi:hypothetical protein